MSFDDEYLNFLRERITYYEGLRYKNLESFKVLYRRRLAAKSATYINGSFFEDHAANNYCSMGSFVLSIIDSLDKYGHLEPEG